MTGNDDGERVGAQCLSDRLPRPACRAGGELAVGDRVARRDRAGGRKDAAWNCVMSSRSSTRSRRSSRAPANSATMRAIAAAIAGGAGCSPACALPGDMPAQGYLVRRWQLAARDAELAPGDGAAAIAVSNMHSPSRAPSFSCRSRCASPRARAAIARRAPSSPASTIASPSTPPPVPRAGARCAPKASATPVSVTPRTSVAVLPPRPLRSRAITSFAANGLSPTLAAAGPSPVPSGSVPRSERERRKGFGGGSRGLGLVGALLSHGMVLPIVGAGSRHRPLHDEHGENAPLAAARRTQQEPLAAPFG